MQLENIYENIGWVTGTWRVSKSNNLENRHGPWLTLYIQEETKIKLLMYW